MEAFGQELSRKKPIFVIYILINAANIDVNLDPNKNFVLFKEQVIVFVKFCIIKIAFTKSTLFHNQIKKILLLLENFFKIYNYKYFIHIILKHLN